MADQITYTPAYLQLVADAERIARERGDGHVSVEHLVIAVFSDPDSAATLELRNRMGADPAELVRRLRWFLDEPKPGPDQYGVRRLDGSVTIHPVGDPGTVLVHWEPSTQS